MLPKLRHGVQMIQQKI